MFDTQTPYQPKNNLQKLDHQVLEQAANILEKHYLRSNQPAFCSSGDTMLFLRSKLAKYDHEVFAVMYLDSQHRLLEFKEMFFGTIDGCSVYPRNIVRHALAVNAAAVVLSHNHPSGMLKPSQADKHITRRITNALELVDVRVLDHVIVGDGTYSFAEHGCL